MDGGVLAPSLVSKHAQIGSRKAPFIHAYTCIYINDRVDTSTNNNVIRVKVECQLRRRAMKTVKMNEHITTGAAYRLLNSYYVTEKVLSVFGDEEIQRILDRHLAEGFSKAMKEIRDLEVTAERF